MPKFFIDNTQITNNQIIITGQDVRHITSVLRLELGDKINVCNKDNGDNFIAEIRDVKKEIIICEVLEKVNKVETQNVEITIFQGLPKADKMELIIQKCTELGVKEIFPVEMERCVVKLDSKSEIKKIERWQRIAEAASKQCRRNNICKINSPTNIQSICSIINDYDILLVPYEDENNNSFKSVLQNNKKDNIKIGIVIGPEGGFDLKEIEELKRHGANIITLGNRILRTETVAVAMTSAIMYEFNELG